MAGVAGKLQAAARGMNARAKVRAIREEREEKVEDMTDAMHGDDMRRDRSAQIEGSKSNLKTWSEEAVAATASKNIEAANAAFAKIERTLKLLEGVNAIGEGTSLNIMKDIRGDVEMNATNQSIIESLWNGDVPLVKLSKSQDLLDVTMFFAILRK